ncbi:hypothetical protein [Arthrobacter gallicola]|uniref:hypothetical protein n=1 Tax=Arthrobacter gallicola TaxID=2762225 RepID=UPI00177AAC90|nr:hypothetical protein [Arthrobacter gallicola]
MNEPHSIRGAEFPNRMAMSPMCINSGTPEGLATDFHVVHYRAPADTVGRAA